MRNFVLPALLAILAGCSAYKLQVRLEGRPSVDMEARVEKTDGFQTVDLRLPPGRWAVSATEPGIRPRLLDQDGRQHVRFELPPDRLLSQRPVDLRMQSLDLDGKPAGPALRVTIDYHTRSQRASAYS